ncbi:ImmA/IrrE family metallo-endopeptidase [Mordavella massiliensis]|nr:ImmA/IrrE family metallo-endopeptidase [Mordavella massiliensis]
MNSLERLEDEACRDGIEIVNCRFNSPRIKGLYCDKTIGLNLDIDTSAEKTCVLAEELGHHHTSVGDILDMTDVSNRKQERQARLWGYNKLIGLAGLINAYEAGCQDRFAVAEYLGVTEEYLCECLNTYRDKYGVGVTVDDYYIMFIPHLAIGKMV